MPTRATLDGIKAKFIFGELEDRADKSQQLLLDLLDKQFLRGGGRDEMGLIIGALKNTSDVLRVITLLGSGRYQEAEDVILGSRRG